MSRATGPGRWRALVAAVALVLLAGCSGPSDTYSPPTAPPTGEPSIDLPSAKAAAGIADCPVSGDQPVVAGGLPDLTLPCLGGGRPVRLAGLRGTPMVINIWAQWCGPCRGEAPHLAEVQKLAGNRIRMIGIDFADPQPGYAIEFAQLAGWRYPQLVDEDRRINASIPFAGPPQTLLVDAEGKIVYRQNGELASTAQLTGLIRDHLGVRL
ncbi:thiol-disulfide isomerase/thioredoxin [Friedmanniella endophytica]|uniref:Thiol-disulfide isomerase/thioredoxin n=1 Tax=Microlunatus kandeliicorticis TaxID=1759536 RepID=A0A7W3IRN5_9ACTN|nr:TlpA disulfide reductase family protein [Microlunatus kandeliicorticis]MBA8793986.1 thiol-disulfide isomerase/thioredoxin [Microlunatus kandeliicorticis]